MSASSTSGAAYGATPAAGLPSSLSVADPNLLLASLPWGVLALAPDGTVALLNPAAEALWGVPAAAVLGHTPAQVQPAVLPAELLRALAPAAEASADATYWLPHTRQWVAMRTAPAPEGGRWVYWDNVTVSQQATQTQHHHSVSLPAGTDTHEHQLAQAAVRQAEERYRTLFNSIDEGYFLCEVLFDEEGTPQDILYLDANPAATRLVGADFRGKRLRDIAPSYEGYWVEIFGRVAQTGVGERLEYYAEPAQKWYDFDLSKIGDEASRRVAVVFQDITERKQHEQALRESEAQNAADLAGMRRLYELQSKLANQTDVQAAFQDVLALACEFTGTDRGCVQFLSRDGQRLEMFVWQGYPEDSPFINFFRYEGLEAGCEVARVQRKRMIIEDTVGFEGLVGTDAGAASYADDIRAAQSTPMTSRSNETIGVISTQFRQPHRPSDHELRLLDMLAWTAAEFLERHRADAALRASEEKYRTLFETMDQGFAVCELLRDEQGRVIDYRYLELNAAWEQHTRQTRAQALGSTARQLVPTLKQGFCQPFQHVVDTGEPTRFEYYAAPLDRWYQCHVFPQGGQRFVTLSDDITDRKQADEILQQSAARQSYLLKLSDALSSVANAVEMQATVTHTTMDYFQADRCYYCEIAGDTVTIRRDAAQPGLPSVAAVYSLSTMPIFQAMVQESQPVVVADTHTSTVMDDNLKQLCLGFGIMAYINVPVVKNGEHVGMLCLTQGTRREWTALEIALVQETAERTWAAVERASAEAALRESEALLQKAFSIETVGLLFFTLDGGMTATNEAFVRLSGYSQEALLTLHWEVLTAPEFWDITARAAGELAEQGETAPYEKQFVRLDGSRWWGLCAPTRLKGHGPTAECVEFVIDISERKCAEQQLQQLMASLEALVEERTQTLRDSQELQQLVFDTSPMAISVQQAVRDANGAIQDFRVLLLNKELARELDRPDMVGKHYVREYPGLKGSGLFDLMRTTVETGEPQHMEYYYPYEGFNRWFSCTFVKLNDGVVATNLDITKRKQAEEERFRNFALLQQSEEIAGLGSWDYNVTTGTFRWSDGMYRLFDLPLGTPVTPYFYLDVVLAEDRPIAERLVHKILQEPSSFEKQLRVRVASQVKTLRLKAEVLRDATGRPERVLGVDLNISAVQRLEAENLHLRLSRQQALFEAVQQAQETERKRIAEDLHNGVGQLLFATKLRLDQLHTPVLTAEPALVAARHEADRLLGEAIHQTRALSHELVPTVLEDFGLAAALQDICRQLSTPQLPLRCHVLLDEEVPPLPALLQLALYRMAQELGLNIVKHAYGATEASLELETTPGFVLLRAEDNGAGFAPDAAAGTGLGLRTIRDRVALLNGTLELGHEPEFGTFVRLRIPLSASPKA